jgi:hypothetical protein
MALCIGVFLSLTACSKQPDATVTDQQPKQRDHTAEINLNLGPLQNLIDAQSRKSIIFAEALRISIQQFLETPDQTRQNRAQDAWLKAHSAYAAVSNLPLPAFVTPDNEISLAANRLRYQLDAWPIEPGYLDSLAAHPGSGIMSDITVPMTLTSLQEQHGFTDVQEVSMGFHALEYLIFVRDLKDFRISDSSTDELKDEPKNSLKHEIILRRRDALRIITEQINLDLASLFAMNKSGYKGLESNSAGDQNQATLGLTLSIVQHLRQAALQVIDNNQRLQTMQVGHGEYSATRQKLMAAELQSLQLTLFEPVNLSALITIDEAGTVEALRATLQEAEHSASSKTISNADRARLALLLAALPHLLDDLTRLIGLASNQPH